MMILIYRRVRKLSMNSVFEIAVISLFEELFIPRLCILLSSSIAPPTATSRRIPDPHLPTHAHVYPTLPQRAILQLYFS